MSKKALKILEESKGYFTGFTEKNMDLIIKFIAYQYNIKEEELNSQEDFYFGDTEVRKLYENENTLVFISIDTCIEVINCISKKSSFAESQTIELH